MFFYLILGVAAALGTAFAVSTKGIYYHSPDTDNELMAYAAAQSPKWRWLSDVHKYSASTRKTSMKEWTIILLAIFQKIFRDKITDRPYTVMTGLAVSICAVLIYLIASDYFSPAIGLMVAILYLISFWPWQISLYGGHANVANLFFLLSAYSIQIAAGLAPVSSFMLIAVGGAFLGFSLFSSPSAYKYFIAMFAALFFNGYRDLFASHDWGAMIRALPLNHLWFFDGIIAAAFLSVSLIILSVYKLAVKKIYHQEAPRFLNKMITARDSFSLEHYLRHAKKKIKTRWRWSFWILFSWLALINLIPALALLALAVGLISVFLMITLPNIKENVVKCFSWLPIHQKKFHFKYHAADFAKIGIIMPPTARGAGPSWIPKMLWIFAPFHVTFFVAVFIIGLYKSFSLGNAYESIILAILAFVSLSPIIWAEITGAPQISRTYSPGLITGLLLPAYVLSGIVWTTYLLIFFSGFVILTFAWNFWRLVNDVYPSRMTVRNFMRVVRRLSLKDIYTYQTSLNSIFIEAIPGIGRPEYLPPREVVPPFRVHYIRRLDEVKDGWIAIPGTNRVAMTLGETKNDDYANDPLRQHLTETRQLDKIAAAKFKTRLNSRIWINEDEVTSYCALHLKYLAREDDLYSGYAWLVHSKEIQNVK